MTKIQTKIDALIAEGNEIEFENRGVSHGPVCDHCGRTGINLIDVYAYKPGEKDENDPVSQLVFIFGTTCIKHFNFDAKPKAPKAKTAKKKFKVELRSEGYGSYSVLQNGEVVGRISGSRSEKWLNLITPESPHNFGARFKYMKPGQKAKRFAKYVLERMTVSEYLESLKSPSEVSGHQTKSPAEVAESLGLKNA